jgi:hypothetical protein
MSHAERHALIGINRKLTGSRSHPIIGDAADSDRALFRNPGI